MSWIHGEPKLPLELKSKDCIVKIHVYDERRRLHKNFECSKSLLVSEAKYFDTYIESEKRNNDDSINISVHCDCYVFEWVMKYIQNPKNAPRLNDFSVIHILIASEFLQIESLVHSCFSYISTYLNETFLTRTDLSMISENAVIALAQKLQPETLLKIPQHLSSTEFMSRIYKSKIQMEFFSHQSTKQTNDKIDQDVKYLACCKYCRKIFKDDSRIKNQCLFTPYRQVIGYRGEFLPTNFCEPYSDWSLSSYITSLHRNKKLTFYEIYWRFWATATVLFTEKGALQSVNTVNFGWSCPKSATFSSDNVSSWGVYPCCGKMDLSFNPWKNDEVGCTPSKVTFDPVRNVQNTKFNRNVQNRKVPCIISLLKAIPCQDFGPLYCSLDELRYSIKNLKNEDKWRSQNNICDNKHIIKNSYKKDFITSVGLSSRSQNKISLLDHEHSKFLRQSEDASIFTRVPSIQKSVKMYATSKPGFEYAVMDAQEFIHFASELGVWINKKRFHSMARPNVNTPQPKTINSEIERKTSNAPVCKFNDLCHLSCERSSILDKLAQPKSEHENADKNQREWLEDFLIDMDTFQMRELISYLSTFREDVDIGEKQPSFGLHQVRPKSYEVRHGHWRSRAPTKSAACRMEIQGHQG